MNKKKDLMNTASSLSQCSIENLNINQFECVIGSKLYNQSNIIIQTNAFISISIKYNVTSSESKGRKNFSDVHVRQFLKQILPFWKGFSLQICNI